MAGHLGPPDDNGWHPWVPDSPGPATVRVQLATGLDGRLVVSRLDLAEPHGITSETLRTLRVARIEAAANAQLGGWGDNTELHPDELLPPATPRAGTSPDGAWAVLDVIEPLAEVSDLDIVQAALASMSSAGTNGRSKPDSFYRDVASAYRQLSVATGRPAAEMAEVTNVPITTVHRWVKEARRRGFLPPGRRGRAG